MSIDYSEHSLIGRYPEKISSPGTVPSIVVTWAQTTGGLLAVKTITRDANGRFWEKPYDNAKYFTYTKAEYPSWGAFAAALCAAARDKHRFLIRGEPRPDLEPGQKARRLWKEGNPEQTIIGPMRWWGVFDLDGAKVPAGLSFIESCLYIRDAMLPPEFRGVRMLATATGSTSRRGKAFHARLYFLLAEPTENAVLEQHTDALREANPNLKLDPSVFRCGQPIYTGRPRFVGMRDPVAPEDWVVMLEGERRCVELSLDQFCSPKSTAYTAATQQLGRVRWFSEPPPPPTDADKDDPFLAEVIAHEGEGLTSEFTPFGEKVLEEAFNRIIEAQPSQRHYTINRESFNVGQRVTEGHIPLWFKTRSHVGDVLMEAAARMEHNDKYSPAELQKKISQGLSEGAARPRSNWGRDDE
jgi:hypothetical protein